MSDYLIYVLAIFIVIIAVLILIAAIWVPILLAAKFSAWFLLLWIIVPFLGALYFWLLDEAS